MDGRNLPGTPGGVDFKPSAWDLANYASFPFG